MAVTKNLWVKTARFLAAPVNVALVLYCAFAAVLIIYHYPVRLDLSADSMNTLTDDMLTCLSRLDRPVEVIISYGEIDPRKFRTTARIVSRAQNVLRQMTLASDKISIVDVIDVQVRGEAWDRLRQRYDLTGTNQATFIYGGRRQNVRMDDMAQLRHQGPQSIPTILSFRVERAFAAALRRLQGEPRKVYFLKNDGQGGTFGRSLRDKSRYGFRELAAELTANNYEVAELDLGKKGKVPGDCDVLMAVGLVGPLPEEIPPLVAYLKSGGSFFFALNSTVDPTLLSFLSEWGVSVERAWTVMQTTQGGMTRTVGTALATWANPTHPITRKFEPGRFRLWMTHGLPLLAVKGRYGELEGIVKAQGKTIWGERQIDRLPLVRDDNDVPSPVTLGGAVLAKVGEKESRIVIFGASSFLTNAMIRVSSDHLSVFHNSLWWLVGQEELVSVRAPEDVPRDIKFDPDGKLRRMLSWTLLVIVPGCAVLLGLAAYFIRRR